MAHPFPGGVHSRTYNVLCTRGRRCHTPDDQHLAHPGRAVFMYTNTSRLLLCRRGYKEGRESTTNASLEEVTIVLGSRLKAMRRQL